MDAASFIKAFTDFLGPVGTFITTVGAIIGTAYIPLRSMMNSRKDQDVNAAKAFRDELRTELSDARKETEELRDKIMELFDKNLALKHENASLQIRVDILTREVERLNQKLQESKQ